MDESEAKMALEKSVSRYHRNRAERIDYIGDSYKIFCRRERVEHVIIESELHTAGAYSLSRINSLHPSVERFFW